MTPASAPRPRPVARFRAGVSLGVFFALLLGLASSSRPETRYLRCGGDLVTEGDLKFDVLNKCGEPAYKESRTEEREVKVFDREKGIFRSVRATVNIEEWTYNFGPHRFLYVVRFRNGHVVEIESGGFGY